jgi:hypothetical protein
LIDPALGLVTWKLTPCRLSVLSNAEPFLASLAADGLATVFPAVLDVAFRLPAGITQALRDRLMTTVMRRFFITASPRW